MIVAGDDHGEVAPGEPVAGQLRRLGLRDAPQALAAAWVAPEIWVVPDAHLKVGEAVAAAVRAVVHLEKAHRFRHLQVDGPERVGLPARVRAAVSIIPALVGVPVVAPAGYPAVSCGALHGRLAPRRLFVLLG